MQTYPFPSAPHLIKTPEINLLRHLSVPRPRCRLFFNRSWKASVIPILRAGLNRAGLSTAFQGVQSYLFGGCQPRTHRETSPADAGEPRGAAPWEQQLGNGLLRLHRDPGDTERGSNPTRKSQIRDACEPEIHWWPQSEIVEERNPGTTEDALGNAGAAPVSPGAFCRMDGFYIYVAMRRVWEPFGSI